jgi:hypothetical protein
MSRPGVSLTGFVTLFGALPTLMSAARHPLPASSQAVGPLGELEDVGGRSVPRVSIEIHVIPAKAGIQFPPDTEPRSPAFAEDKLRGGDVLAFISVGGLLPHDHSPRPGA